MAELDLSFWIRWVSTWKAAGVDQAVVAAGSRSAPLLQALLATGWRIETAVDERSAAYQALGMAQAQRRPVVVLTTSGTAAANLLPAVAEAYFAEVPLVVWTADRPPEWIGHEDNQAIYQTGLYHRHVRGEWALPDDLQDSTSASTAEKITKAALRTLGQSPSGPVHLNIPLREPLYATPTERVNVPTGAYAPEPDWPSIDPEWEDLAQRARRPLILHGLGGGAGNWGSAPQVGEILALQGDRLPAEAWVAVLERNDDLRPDLVVTTGGPFLSKELRQRLRGWDFNHAHLGGKSAKVFQRPVLTCASFPFAEMAWTERWREVITATRRQISGWWAKPRSLEFTAVQQLVTALPPDTQLHLGNSLPVRIAGLLPHVSESLRVHSNRGTSGIDGSLSTALGHAVAKPAALHVALLGDLSFFYDRNALWRESLPSNLKVVVLNNQGGAIFRALPGPSDWGEDFKRWTTPHRLSAQRTAEDHGLTYLPVRSADELTAALPKLLTNKGPALLEVFTDGEQSATDYRDALKFFRETTLT